MKRHHLLPFLLALLVLSGGCSSLSPTWAPWHKTKRVAVINFENLTGEAKYNYLEGAMGEYLTNHLANSGILLLRDRQDITRTLDKVDASESDAERCARLRILGRKIDTEYLVVGGVSLLDDNFILTARLFSVSRGEVLTGSAIEEACKQEYELYYRAQRIGAFMVDQLKAQGALEELKPASEESTP